MGKPAGCATLTYYGDSVETITAKFGIGTRHPRAHPKYPWLFAQSVQSVRFPVPAGGNVTAEVLFGPVDFIVELWPVEPDSPTIVEAPPAS